MSNRTIIDRLVADIQSCQDTPQAKKVLAERVLFSVEAMDGIPYEVVKEANDFEYLLTLSSFHDEEGFESYENLAAIKQKLVCWLQQIENGLFERGVQ